MISRDLTIPRKSDFVLDAHFKTGNTPLNVAGWKFWLTAKKSLDQLDADAVFQKTATPSFGTSVSFHITEADTAESGNFYYDLKALSPAGYGAPLMGGKLTVPPVATLAAS